MPTVAIIGASRGIGIGLVEMKGLFVEWLWRRHAVAGAAAFALLLLTSAGAAPFNLRNVFTGQDTLGTHLIQLVREVHRPYRDSVSIVSDYLLRNAERDDLVYVPGFADREVLRCSGLPASGRGGP